MSTPQPYFGKQALSVKESSHDSLDSTKHTNWLSNNAGLGIYAHGRIHQEVEHLIYVGDLIHKRGHMTSEDILLMEEQELLSMSDPLSTNSKLGKLRALAVLPTMNTANGEGDLIAYYEHGVVAFNTGIAPRETRHDGNGKEITAGWDTKRLVSHLLNYLGAVGRYAVAVLPRDHLFRSRRGLHFLSVALGQGTFNSENTNRISTPIDPILDTDTDLSGAACGFWIEGDRMFCTTGLKTDPLISASSFGRGFVSWNQAVTFTEDRTPRPAWEGLWLPDDSVAGIHCFFDHSELGYGFLCSDKQGSLMFAAIEKDATSDSFEGAEVPVEWSFETGRFAPSGLNISSSINGITVEFVVSSPKTQLRVLSRTDRKPNWALWGSINNSDIVTTDGQSILRQVSLGKPNAGSSDCTWIQFRVEGIGNTEIQLLELDFSTTTAKTKRNHKQILPEESPEDYFKNHDTPQSERWQQD